MRKVKVMRSRMKLNEIERRRLLEYCRQRDVNRGGIFDESCRLSQLIGTISLRVGHIEIEGEVPIDLLGLPLSVPAHELANFGEDSTSNSNLRMLNL